MARSRAQAPGLALVLLFCGLVAAQSDAPTRSRPGEPTTVTEGNGAAAPAATAQQANATTVCVDNAPSADLTCAQHKERGDCKLADFVAGGWCKFTCGHCSASARGELVTLANGTQIPIEQVTPLPAPPAMPTDSSFCGLPAETGPCRASIPRWAFNATRKRCVAFVWGGCQGNANNFYSAGDCEKYADQFCGGVTEKANPQEAIDLVKPVYTPKAPGAEPAGADSCARSTSAGAERASNVSLPIAPAPENATAAEPATANGPTANITAPANATSADPSCGGPI